jgi:hypothetical protein
VAKRAKKGAARESAQVSVPPESPSPLRVFAPVLVAVALLAFALACFDIDDYDLWWQLRAGRWMAEHGGPPRTEVFTHTRQGIPWVDTEWGAEILLYLVMRVAGAPGLISLVGILAAVAACCLVLASRDEGAGPAAAGLAAAGALFLVHFRLYPRAELFTFLSLSVLLLLLGRWRRGARWSLVGIPVLFLVWGNVHPGVLSGGLVLACYVTGEALARFMPPRAGDADGRRPLGPLFAASSVAALALLANPYGFRAPLEWLRLAGSEANRYVLEWAPPTHEIFTHRAFVQGYRVWTAILVLSLPILWIRRRLGGALAAGALLPLAMRSVRVIAAYGIATAPAMAVSLDGWIALAARRRAAKAETPAAVTVASLLVLVALLVVQGSFYRWEGETRRFGFGMNLQDYPVQALNFLRANDIRGTVYNEYRWGGWLGWVDGMKVFEDGRTIDETLFREGSAVLAAAPGFEDILDRYRVDVLFLRHPKDPAQSKALFRWLASSPEWALVFWDDVALVYLRRVPRFERIIDRFAYRHLLPLEIPASKAALQNDWARVEAEVDQVKTWSPRCIIRQIAGQLYAAFGMVDRAKAEYLEGYRLDSNSPFWEPRLKALGAWPPR